MSKKRSRLFMSLVALAFCVGVMCFGVYAATSVSYTLSGHISYEVNDVFVDIETSLYKSTQNYQDSMYNMASELLNLDEYFNLDKTDTISSTLEKTSFVDSFSNRNTISGEEIDVVTSQEQLPIDFGSYAQDKSYAYYIVITVKNYGSNVISGKLNIDSLYAEGLNIYVAPLQTMEDIDAGTSTTPSSYSFVVCLALKDVSQSTNAQFDNLTLTINNHSLQDEVNYDDFVFNYDDYDYYEFDVCTIAEYTGSETKVIFPKTDPNGKLINMIGYDEDCVLLEGTQEVYIPDSIEYIPFFSFDNINNSLRSLYVPNSVKFVGCYLGISPVFIFPSEYGTGIQEGLDISIEGINFEGEQVSYAISSSSELFAVDDGVIYSKDKTELVHYPMLRTGSFEIPSGVTSIGEAAFFGRTSLSEVTIPSSVTSIGSRAFSECTSLSKITIPSSVKSIGERAFFGCTSLTEITILSSVTSIGSYVFCGCTSLSEITIPNTVESIGDFAFSGCTSLREITIPNSVESIGSHAFSNCNSLNSVTFEASDSVWTLDDSNNTEIRVNEHDASVLATYLTKSTYVTPPGYCVYTWTKN